MSSGIVRRVDDLGRIVIPKEIRKTVGIYEGDPLEISVNEDSTAIILAPYNANLSNKIEAVARNLSNYNIYGFDCEEIIEELRAIAKKIEKIEKNA